MDLFAGIGGFILLLQEKFVNDDGHRKSFL